MALTRVQIHTAGLRPLPDSGRLTGMYKQPAVAALRLRSEGFDGDMQADLRVHGGPDKAVHLYPSRHYAALAAAFAHAAPSLRPGSIGENLSTADLDERDVHVGDVWSLGDALLQACQPRNPCWKIDERFGCPGMAAFIVRERITGWYWRVLREGLVQPLDTLRLVERHAESPSLHAALRTWHDAQAGAQELQRLADCPGIAAHWRGKIEQRIAWLREQAAQQA